MRNGGELVATRRLLIAVLLLGACASTGGGYTTSATSTALLEGLPQVDRVEVQILPSRPTQVRVRVQGVLLDGCTSLGSVSQEREGNEVTVTIKTVHTRASICTQVAQLVDTTVRLEGAFPPGPYLVRVNGVEKRFRV